MSTPRPRTLRPWLALCALAIALTVWTIGCKQGEGERCQSDDDCEGSSLTCNLATLTCSSANTSGQIDASVPDGPPADAAIDAIDAPPDSSIDAMIDAP